MGKLATRDRNKKEREREREREGEEEIRKALFHGERRGRR